MSNLKEYTLGSTVYVTIHELKGIHENKSAELLSGIDLKPIQLALGSYYDGDNVTLAQVFKNGFLGLTVTEILTKIGKSNLLQEFASLMLVEKGKESHIKTAEDWEADRIKIRDALLWENAEITHELVGFFLKKNVISKRIMQNFFNQETEAENQ